MATRKTTTTATKTTAKTRTKSLVEDAETTKHDNVSAVKTKMKTFDSNEYVTVKNGFHGTLFYRDYSTGETYQWN